jgi:hypothetical protein
VQQPVCAGDGAAAHGVLARCTQVDGDMTVDTLKAILEAECGVPSTQQALVVNNRVLKDK